MGTNALVRSGWLPVAAALLGGCTTVPADERAALSHGVAADVVLVGRFVASEDIEVFQAMGRELSHVSEAWRVFTFRTAGEPGAQVRFAGPSTSCPPAPLDDRTFIVALRRGVPGIVLGVSERGRLTSLLLIACAPIDPARSDSFIRPW